MADPTCPYVSRAGLKLAAALDAFDVSVAGLTCADFGSNVGGFVDCLLQRGAARVYSIDTGYGVLAWKLRKDKRVVVMERTNVLRAPCPEPVDLLTVDVGWTPQRVVAPIAAQWLKPAGQMISLIKPHYEATAAAPRGRGRHVLDEVQARRQCDLTCQEVSQLGWRPRAVCTSPIVGAGGNVEFLLLADPPVDIDRSRA